MRTSLLCLVLAWVATPAVAQTPPTSSPRLPRADASVSLGWLNAEVSAVSHAKNNWANRRATVGGQAGVYWTEHVKTEFVVERSNSQQVWEASSVFLPDARSAWRNGQHQIQDTRFSVGQFYQFGHNAWAHASIGGGLSVTRRAITSELSPLVIYDGRSQVVLEPGTTRSAEDVRTNAFLGVAVKSYVTPRLFVRSEAQADFRTSLDAVVLRIGFGVDF